VSKDAPATFDALAAQMNHATVKVLQAELRKLRRALRKIASGDVAREFGLRAVFEYERIAQEALAK
jgi:hypothetical protein